MRTSSNQVHAYPRSVSMATPTRPSFFSRNSSSRVSVNDSFVSARSSPPSPRGTGQPGHIEHRSISVPEPKTKKKGFKGFLQKLGGGKRASRAGSSSVNLATPQREGEEELSDLGAPLAPPPPLSYLVERGDRQHAHNRSGTSSAASILTNQSGGGPAPQMRSVSAPMQSPSSGSLSLSPTSSRFATTNSAQRESYASLGRRRSGLMDDSDSVRQRDSGVEILDGKVPAQRHSAYGLTNDPGEHARWVETPNGRRVSVHQGAASLSNSSGTMLAPSLETPPPVPFSAQQFYTSQNQFAPLNRQKTLPPLPPPGDSGSASPDSFVACFPNGGYTADPGLLPNRPRAQTDRRTMSMASGSEMDYDEYAPSRSQRLEQSPRLAQPMYAQSGNGSYASFGGDMEGGGKRGKAKGRFGLSGLLGGGKKDRGQRGSAEISDALGESSFFLAYSQTGLTLVEASSPRSQASFYR